MERKILIGIDIGGTDTKLGLVCLDGTLLAHTSIPTESRSKPEATLRRVSGEIDTLLIRTGYRRRQIRACGVGIPGPLDTGRERLLHAPNLPGWSRTDIRSAIQKYLRTAVVLENDANMALWGEHWVGQAKHLDTFIMLTLGTGVGGGIMIENRLWTGPWGGAAELGHVVVVPGGRRCGCGAHGCVEAYASATAMVSDYRARTGTSLTAKEVFDLARDGRAVALRVIRAALDPLATALANFIHILEPRLIVLGGGLSRAGPILLKILVPLVKQRVLPAYRGHVRIRISTLGSNAGLLGAAGWALSQSEISVS